jgi:hypothetical protein
MTAKITEIELEKRVRSIENETITKIWYHQMENGTEIYNGNDFHSVDTAIYLHTANKKIFKIFWADEFGLYHGFGISLKEISVMDKDNGVFTDVSEDKDYKGIIGTKINSVMLYWQDVIDNMRWYRVPFLGMGYIRRKDYPQTLELNFDNGIELFVSAMKISDDNKCVPFDNHLTVFFNKSAIDKYYKPLRKL